MSLQFVVKRCAEVGGLGADEEVVFIEDLFLAERAVSVDVGLVNEVLALRDRVVVVVRHDPRLHLHGRREGASNGPFLVRDGGLKCPVQYDQMHLTA